MQEAGGIAFGNTGLGQEGASVGDARQRRASGDSWLFLGACIHHSLNTGGLSGDVAE